jgi:hypothetical protein
MLGYPKVLLDQDLKPAPLQNAQGCGTRSGLQHLNTIEQGLKITSPREYSRAAAAL